MIRGRFAPSPTGPLHFGSLIAAVASYLHARTQGGQWLVRMEDLDTPRVIPGAADAILATLEHFGFEWEGEVMYQSRRQEAYAEALSALQAKELVYPCGCTRKEIADSALQGIDGPIYPGTCRKGLGGKPSRAWRVRVNEAPLAFQDQVQGLICQQLARDIGDFVVKRADGLFAYQLAVVVDDAFQGITHVVRGADLLDSTPRQLYLQQALGLACPAYAHVPVAANAAGEKLSKQTLAKALEIDEATIALWHALAVLNQSPPAALQSESLPTLWNWAYAHWRMDAIPRCRWISHPYGSVNV